MQYNVGRFSDVLSEGEGSVPIVDGHGGRGGETATHLSQGPHLVLSQGLHLGGGGIRGALRGNRGDRGEQGTLVGKMKRADALLSLCQASSTGT